jgi:hypothetical protein
MVEEERYSREVDLTFCADFGRIRGRSQRIGNEVRSPLD